MYARFRSTLYVLLLAGFTTVACQPSGENLATPGAPLPANGAPIVASTASPIPSLSSTAEATALDTNTPVPTLPPRPEAVWTYSTGGAIWGSPALSNGVVYFGSDDGNLYSVDAEEGTLKWSFQTQGIVRSMPAIAGNQVFFASDDGFLYAVNLDSGGLNWRTDIGDYLPHEKRVNLANSTEPTGYDYKQSSPIVVDGQVYVGSLDGKVYCLAADTGRIGWVFKTGERIRATPTLADGILYIGSWDKNEYALNAADGRELWQTDVQGQVQTTALVTEGVVVTASRRASVFGLDAQTGKVKWERKYGDNMWVESSPVQAGNICYIGSSGHQPVLGMECGTGKLAAVYFGEAFYLSTPAIANDILYIGVMNSRGEANNKGGLAALQLVGGKIKSPEQWIYPTPDREKAQDNWNGVAGSPAIQDGIVYFGGLDGKFYAVEVKPPTGKPPAAPIQTKITPSVLPSASSFAPEDFWTLETGMAIWSSPVVEDGIVYFGSDDGSLYALDTRTRLLRWKFPTGGFVRSRPAIAEGIIYFTSDDGYLYALRSDSGARLWRVDLGAKDMPERGDLSSRWDYQQSSPVFTNGKVYVGSGTGGLFAFDAATGDQLWKFETIGPVRDSPAVAGNLVFIGDKMAFLHAVDTVSGVEKWRAQGCDIPTPLVMDGLVYCGSRATYDLRAWDIDTGEVRWMFSYQGSWVESSPQIADGTLYIGSSDAKAIFALDPRTGEQRWKFPTGAYTWSTPEIISGVVYVGAFSVWKEKNLFYALDARTGQLVWALHVPKGVVSSPTLADGFVYFGGLDGKLYAVRVSP